jgi:hypothetical protein
MGKPVSEPRRKRKREETGETQKIVEATGCLLDFRIFRNNCGVAEFESGAKVRYGLAVGSGDLIGILRMPSGLGRFVSFEVKSLTGKLSEKQAAWARAIRAMGGFACTVRSAAEALAALDRARAGASE